MNDEVVLISGASTGFGRLLAETLRRMGKRPVASMREVEGKNAKAASELKQNGIDVVEIDVTDEASVTRGTVMALERAGRIDVLVNNAGYAFAGPLEGMTTEELRTLYETNVFGVHRMVRAVLPSMRKRGEGLLVHVSSLGGRSILPGAGAYCSSKWALEALGEALRYELAPLGIDSVIVEPGSYETDYKRSVRVPTDSDRASAYAAVRTVLEKQLAVVHRDPQEVVDAIVRLIEAPRGKRPIRTVIPGVPILEKLNATQAAIGRGALEALGMPELLANEE